MSLNRYHASLLHSGSKVRTSQRGSQLPHLKVLKAKDL